MENKDFSSNPPLEIDWHIEFNMMLPFCPSCQNPVYNLEDDECCFCHQKLIKGESKYLENTEIKIDNYEIVQIGGANSVIISKDGQCISHMSCSKKFTEEELKNILKSHINQNKEVWKDARSIKIKKCKRTRRT